MDLLWKPSLETYLNFNTQWSLVLTLFSCLFLILVLISFFCVRSDFFLLICIRICCCYFWKHFCNPNEFVRVSFWFVSLVTVYCLSVSVFIFVFVLAFLRKQEAEAWVKLRQPCALCAVSCTCSWNASQCILRHFNASSAISMRLNLFQYISKHIIAYRGVSIHFNVSRTISIRLNPSQSV